MSLNHVVEYNRDIRQWLLKVFKLAADIPKQCLVRRPCPVCGSGDSRFFANNDYFDYKQCEQCRLVFMDPAPPAEMIDKGFLGEDQLIMEYFSIISKYKTDLPEKPNPLTDSKLMDIYTCKHTGRLLDVGCSVGDFLHKAKYFYDVEGLEVNPDTAAIAEQHFTVHKAFLADAGLDATYDIVTLHQILYGIPDPVGLLRDIHEVLRDDGILYINTPNVDSHAVKVFGGKVNHLYGYTSQNIFNRSSLEWLAGVTGFRIRAFRTEWLDVYTTDLVEFHNHPDLFIHKRNCHLPDYEEKIRMEDEFHRLLNFKLGDGGNYIVAVFEKV